jgi:stage V sporulation protein B
MKINRIKRYFLSAITLSSGSIVLSGLAVLFNLYVSGKIGAEAMGLYTLTGGVYGFAITLATSGVNLAVVRLVSGALPYGESNQKIGGAAVFKIMKQALFYVLFFSILSSVLLFSSSRFVGAYLLGDIRVVPALRVMAFSLVPI